MVATELGPGTSNTWFSAFLNTPVITVHTQKPATEQLCCTTAGALLRGLPIALSEQVGMKLSNGGINGTQVEISSKILIGSQSPLH